MKRKRLPINQIIQGDCLEVMKELPDKSIDMILCDLPYGTTACEWDTIIPFEPLWEQYERIIKDNGAIVLTASQPFTTSLIASNMAMFKYCWIWKKPQGVNPFMAKYRPLNNYEDVCVFSIGTTKYYPQMDSDKPYTVTRDRKSRNYEITATTMKQTTTVNAGFRHPTRIIEFNQERGLHPTQKPVALFEYLIKTYTQPGEIVLDNCIGSGTTAVACLNTGRNYIGIEIEKEYVKIAKDRVEACKKQNQMRLFPLSKLEKTSKKYKGLFE